MLAGSIIEQGKFYSPFPILLFRVQYSYMSDDQYGFNFYGSGIEESNIPFLKSFSVSMNGKACTGIIASFSKIIPYIRIVYLS